MMKAVVILILIESLSIVHTSKSKPRPYSSSKQSKPPPSEPESSSTGTDDILKEAILKETILNYELLKCRSKKFFEKNPLPNTAKAFKNRLLNFPDKAQKLVDFAKNTRIVVHSKLHGFLLRELGSISKLWENGLKSYHKVTDKQRDEYELFYDIWGRGTELLRQKLKNYLDKSKSSYYLWRNSVTSGEERELDRYLHHLFKHRPLAFIGPGDRTRLRNSERTEAVESSPEHWSKGKYEGETYLKYSEMEISALLGMSGPTLFLSDCDRDNPREDERVEEGVIIGIVGARFEKRDKMESRYILFPFPKEHGPVDKLMARLFDFENLLNSEEEQRHMVSELEKESNSFANFADGTGTKTIKGFVFRKVKSEHPEEPSYFNETIYRRRMRLIAETVLGEANDRALKGEKRAYVIVASIGTGAWKLFDGQEKLFLEELIDVLERSNSENVSDLDLRYFGGECKSGKVMRGGKETVAVTNQAKKQIAMHCGNDPPAKLKKNEMEGKLVVLTYPWDSNSFPGNEYWVGAFNSGDPAAARCSLITELHNPYVNHFLDPENQKIAHVVV